MTIGFFWRQLCEKHCLYRLTAACLYKLLDLTHPVMSGVLNAFACRIPVGLSIHLMLNADPLEEPPEEARKPRPKKKMLSFGKKSAINSFHDSEELHYTKRGESFLGVAATGGTRGSYGSAGFERLARRSLDPRATFSTNLKRSVVPQFSVAEAEHQEVTRHVPESILNPAHYTQQFCSTRPASICYTNYDQSCDLVIMYLIRHMSCLTSMSGSCHPANYSNTN